MKPGKCRIALLLGVLCKVGIVHGHGRLMEPPNRSSLWRFSEFDEYEPPENFEDNQLFCGGFEVQYEVNSGRCGLCGDAWNQTEPRDNELGGYYGLGIITRRYRSGQTIRVDVELTTPHLGFWELRLCPYHPATQACFDRYLLHFSGGRGTRFYVTNDEGDADEHFGRYYSTTVQLPRTLRCERCQIQWRYYTGNRWGTTDGDSCVGCGDQEEFRSCADVAIY